ncbi:hypothetical protein AVEN_121673-1, partial [Araneus ventricosus]
MSRDCFQYASKTRRPKCLLPYKISPPELVFGKLPSFGVSLLLRMRMELTSLVSHVLSQSCEQSYYERCLKQLVEFTDRGDLLFATSEDQLRQECV